MMNSSVIPHYGDSHFHILEMLRKGQDPLVQLEFWFSQGVDYLLDVGVDLQGWETRSKAAMDHPRLFLASGVHPGTLKDQNFNFQPTKLKEQLKNPKNVALGEIGLDYYRNSTNKSAQITLFQDQLDMAKSMCLPIIIHNREADDDLLSILQDIKLEKTGVFHCFSSNAQTARKGLDLGYYISFSGNVTYKNSQDIQQAAKIVPMDRILVETDSPYLSPEGLRGKPNMPTYGSRTLEFLAYIRGELPETLALQIKENFIRLFNPPGL